MLKGNYEKTNMRLPVMGTDGAFHDVFGYTECYWDCDFFFFHMPDGGAVIYKIGNTGYNGVIPKYKYWTEVAEKWFPNEKNAGGNSGSSLISVH